MLRSPLQRLKNEHVECSLQQLNPVFILLFLAHRCRHSTRMAVDCLLPIMATPQRIMGLWVPHFCRVLGGRSGDFRPDRQEPYENSVIGCPNKKPISRAKSARE